MRPVARIITIRRPEVVALIEAAAAKLTGGNKTEAVALAMRRLLERNAQGGQLFGAHDGSVRIREDVDLTAPSSMSCPMPRPVTRSAGNHIGGQYRFADSA